MMFPFMQEEIEHDKVDLNTDYKEFAFDFVNQRLTGGIVYREEALKVWIYHALKTTRYNFSIYSWDYGEDVSELIGQGYDKGYIDAEVERRVKECLMINEKIKNVYDFDISFKDGHLTGNFKVDSIYGEVNINV